MRKIALLLPLVFAQLLTAVSPVQASTAIGKNSLVVNYREFPDSPIQKWTLKCSPSGGSMKKAYSICRKMNLLKDPFILPPKDQMCAQIFESSEVATVKGFWNGKTISNTYSKSDGCEQARWKRISFLIQGIRS